MHLEQCLAHENTMQVFIVVICIQSRAILKAVI